MKLIINFFDRSKDFVQGVEFGRIFEKIENGLEEISNNGYPVRIQNQLLIHDACIKYGYTPFFKDCYVSGWVNFKAIKKQ